MLAQLKNDRSSNSPPGTATTGPSTSLSTVSSRPDTRAQTPGSAGGAAQGAIVSREAKTSAPGGKSGGGGGADDEEMGEASSHFCLPPECLPLWSSYHEEKSGSQNTVR